MQTKARVDALIEDTAELAVAFDYQDIVGSDAVSVSLERGGKPRRTSADDDQLLFHNVIH